MGISYIVFTVYIWIVTAPCVAVVDVTVLFLCDKELHETCKAASDKFPFNINVHDIYMNITGLTIPSSGDYITDLRKLDRTASKPTTPSLEKIHGADLSFSATSKTLFLIGFGMDSVVNAVTCVSREKNIPSFVYSTSYHRTYTYSKDVFPVHPSHKGLAKAILTVIDKQMIGKLFVFCQDSFLTDGFLEAFENEIEHNRLNRSQRMVVAASMNDLDLRMTLWNIHDQGYRLLVVHTTPQLFERILSIAEDLAMFGIGYAWMISEVALSHVPVITDSIQLKDENQHPGLLAVDGYEEDKYEDIMEDVIKVIIKETEKALKEVSKLGTVSRRISDSFQSLLSTTELLNTTFREQLYGSIGRNEILYKADGSRRNAQFRLLNFVKNTNPNFTQWKPIGIINENKLDLHTVVWPGPTIFGPSKLAREFFTIVTRPAEPFVYVRGPVQSRQECAADTECLHIYTHDKGQIKEITEVFKNQQTNSKLPYDVYCCEGIVVDLLHSLSVELSFDFLLYFKNDTDYGTQINGSWTGMVADVVSGAADMMAGAISITSNRLQAVSFTEAFYFASYEMVSYSNSRYTTLLAFMSPFDTLVWIMIIVSATCVAVATSLFEWNSPFGLNPWGKRRKKNYTLGSALTMVYAMWFGHTVKTKSPKSWPSKFLQNCWSCLSIFVLASYTANLAAFLAGNSHVETSYSVLDSRLPAEEQQLSTKRIGVIRSSAVEKYINEINPGLNIRLKKYYVKSVEEAFDKLRRNELDLYADDSPLLEYALSKFDDTCTINVASHSFGEGSYGIGFPKETWLKDKFDRLMLNYVEHGYIEDFKWRYMGKNRQCVGNLVTSSKTGMQFGWEHTHGLFVFLLVTIGLSVVLLALEHLTYFVIVPILKKRTQDSIWKSRNMEYFSQRLYKSINSEKVEAPAKVLLSKVRQTKFDLKTKMKRQMRSVPADMVSYQMQNQDLATLLQLAYKNAQESDSQEDEDVFTVSGKLENEINEDIFDIITKLSKQQQYRSVSIPNCYSLPKAGKTRWSSVGWERTMFNVDSETDVGFHNNRRSKLKRLRSSLYRSRKKKLTQTGRGFYNPAFEADVDDFSVGNKQSPVNKSTSMAGVSSMNEIRNPWERDMPSILEQNRSPLSDRVCFSKTDNCKRERKRYETWPSPKTRKRSVKRKDINNSVSFFDNRDTRTVDDAVRIVNSIPTISCSSCSDNVATNSDLNVNLVLKDNRVKSSLRDHAMSTVERRSHSMAFDRGAVEALSKEDLLVLWKRSEIELQTRLNRTLHQNNHLRQLVHIAEVFHGQDNGTNMEEISSDVENTENPDDDEYAVTRL